MHQILYRIVHDLTPYAGAPTVRERYAAPGGVAFSVGMRNDLVAPQLLASGYIVACDIATVRRVLAAAPCDQNAVGNDRAAGVGNIAVGSARRLPGHLTG